MVIKKIIAILMLVLATYAIVWEVFLKPVNKIKLLNIVSYSSFSGSQGPGIELKKQFEKKCQCQVRLWSVNDSTLLLRQVKEAKYEADLIVGIDQLMLGQALELFEWEELSINTNSWFDVGRAYQNIPLVPYDWAPMTILFRNGKVKPVKDLSKLFLGLKEKQLSLQDPRSSTPGFQFQVWLQSQFSAKELSEWNRKTRSKIHSYASSWSMSYGLFQKSLTDATFSYVTSLIYHWDNEGSDEYRAMSFRQPHPYQIEFVGIPDICKNCELAKQFVQHMLSTEGQTTIMKKNYMYPIVESVIKGTSFERLPKLKILSRSNFDKLNRQAIIDNWKKQQR